MASISTIQTLLVTFAEYTSAFKDLEDEIKSPTPEALKDKIEAEQARLTDELQTETKLIFGGETAYFKAETDPSTALDDSKELMEKLKMDNDSDKVEMLLNDVDSALEGFKVCQALSAAPGLAREGVAGVERLVPNMLCVEGASHAVFSGTRTALCRVRPGSLLSMRPTGSPAA